MDRTGFSGGYFRTRLRHVQGHALVVVQFRPSLPDEGVDLLEKGLGCTLPE